MLDAQKLNKISFKNVDFDLITFESNDKYEINSILEYLYLNEEKIYKVLDIEKERETIEDGGTEWEEDTIYVNYIDYNNFDVRDIVEIKEKRYLFHCVEWNESKYGGAVSKQGEYYVILDEFPCPWEDQELQRPESSSSGYFCFSYELLESYNWFDSNKDIFLDCLTKDEWEESELRISRNVNWIHVPFT